MKSFVKFLFILGLIQPVLASDCIIEIVDENSSQNAVFRPKLSNSIVSQESLDAENIKLSIKASAFKGYDLNTFHWPQEILHSILSQIGGKAKLLNRACYERYSGDPASPILKPVKMDFSEHCHNLFSCTRYMKQMSSSMFEKDANIVVNFPPMIWSFLKDTHVKEINIENSIRFSTTPLSILESMAVEFIPQGPPLKGTRVRTLRFERRIINDAFITELDKIIAESPVRNIEFNNSFMVPQASENFWSMIFKNPIKNLKISNSRINDNDVISMFRLSKDFALTCLDLSNNNIGSLGALALIDHFKEKSMKSLNLENNKITNNVSSEFNYVLRQNSFTELNFRGNKFTDSGVLDLVEMLARTSATRLYCDENNIRSTGVKELIQKLHSTSPSNLSSWEINQLFPEAYLAEQTIFGFNYGKPKKYLGEMWKWSTGYIWNSNYNQ